jgi:Fe-S-cluster containining protein
MATGMHLLRFRCTGCGNCCRDPLLPITDSDLRRVVNHTKLPAKEVVKWVDRHGIDLPGEHAYFALLRAGRRVMVLRHSQGHCRFLGADDRCTIYEERPLGCRIFPFDPDFNRQGKLVRLRFIQATECPYEKDGSNNVTQLRSLNRRTESELDAYQSKVLAWNVEQKRRLRRGLAAATTAAYLNYLGFD